MSTNDISPTAHATAPNQLYTALSAPFPEHDLEWRVGSCGSGNNGIWARVVPYLTNRAIQDRLDQVMGPENWKNRYEPLAAGGFLCGLSLRINGEWVEKFDGAEATDIEALKGGLSGSMKRAAVQWGIGRFLYGINDCWADIHEKGAHYGKTKDNQSFRWDPPKLNLASQFIAPEGTLPRPTPAPVVTPAGAGAAPTSTPSVTPTPSATSPNKPPASSTPGKAECDQLYWDLVSEKGLLPAEYKPLVTALFKGSPTMEDRYSNLNALKKSVQNIYSAMGQTMGANMVKDITLGCSIDRKSPTADDAGEWLHSLVHTSETGELLTGMEKKQ